MGLDEIQAGFLLVKLQHMDEIDLPKRELVRLYLENFKDDFIKPVVHPDHYDICHIFNVRTLSLPLSYGHSDDDMFMVIDVMNKF